MPPAPKRLSAFDLVEALQLAHAAAALHELGIFASAMRPATARALAGKHRVNAAFLRGALDFVAARTDLIRRVGPRFATTSRYAAASRFLLDLYAGAYRRNAAELATLMAKPARAAAAVDRARHARAFENTGAAPGPLANFVRQLELTSVVDLGCGPGALLVHLAAADADFAGWGIDANPAMCRAARRRILDAGLGKRVRVIRGDASRLKALLRADVRARIQAVTASQFANEMFGAGDAAAVAWLRRTRQALPGRLLLLADYYGRLGGRSAASHRETLLHDYAQLISGQGVPPASAAAWRAIYARAGCELLHAIEDRATTLFVHVVILGSSRGKMSRRS